VDAASDEYHTPLAGKPLRTTIFGEEVDVAARDRGKVLALTLGGAFYIPPIGDTSASPLAALYARHYWGDLRLRAVVSVFYNEIDLGFSLCESFEALGHIENYTVPFPQTETVDNEVVTAGTVEWGTASAWLGGGLRIPVEPLEADSLLRVQLFAKVGVLYVERSDDTGPDVRLPSDTAFWGFHVRIRYDGLRRNLLELPHAGIAAGIEGEFVRRDRWRDYSIGTGQVSGSRTREYGKLTGYVVGAMGVPGLSERHRLVGYVNGSIAPDSDVDRFSAFRIGGGPFPSETDDLHRALYPGTLFNQGAGNQGVVATLEYRYEVFFFLYVHARATLGWGRLAELEQGNIRFDSVSGEAFTLAATSGFLWHSSIYLEYAYDTGVLRNGHGGSSVLFMWSKAF